MHVFLSISRKYTTIKIIVDVAPRSSSEKYVIYIKGEVYDKIVEIKLTNIMLVGEGIGKTIITSNKSYGGGIQTF